jgi:hypothetical protein
MAEGIKLDATFVGDQIRRLHAAFPRSTKMQSPEMTISVWRDGLAGIDRDAVEGSIGAIIRDDEHFPRISRVREMARQWIKRNRGDVVREYEGGRVCPNCGDAYVVQRRYRVKTTPVLGNAVAFELTDDNAAVLLEPFERELCKCAVPSPYAPELTRKELCVLVGSLTPYDQQRLAAQKHRRALAVGSPTWAKAGKAVAPVAAAGAIAESVVERAAETGGLSPEQHRRREAVA